MHDLGKFKSLAHLMIEYFFFFLKWIPPQTFDTFDLIKWAEIADSIYLLLLWKSFAFIILASFGSILIWSLDRIIKTLIRKWTLLRALSIPFNTNTSNEYNNFSFVLMSICFSHVLLGSTWIDVCTKTFRIR